MDLLAGLVAILGGALAGALAGRGRAVTPADRAGLMTVGAVGGCVLVALIERDAGMDVLGLMPGHRDPGALIADLAAGMIGGGLAVLLARVLLMREPGR